VTPTTPSTLAEARQALIVSLGEPLPALVSISDVCRVLRISRYTVYRFMATGALPYCHVGERRRVPVAALESYLAGQFEERSA
jgi:excisionase family DNA binding protein